MPVTIEYDEGADIGYRWFAETGATPMYAFGHGLRYTTFEYGDLEATAAEPARPSPGCKAGPRSRR